MGNTRGIWSWERQWILACILLIVGLWTSTVAAASAPPVVHIRIDGVINPIKVRYVQHALEMAEEKHASLLLVSIDTPGGLVTSMEKICSSFVNAKIPVVGYVEPPSAQATSAGSFILLATDVAAMAPSTRVGAAHPVAMGKNLEGALNDKVTNTMVALAKSLAKRTGRPESFAEQIVRSSSSFTVEEALKLGAVEMRAPTERALLDKLDGYELKVDGKPHATLHTKGAVIVQMPLSRVDRFLDLLADPTIASILMSLGVLGILYELKSPGIGLGGIVGASALILGLVAMSTLPLHVGGLLLILAGLAAIAVEIKAQTHGLLAAGGVIVMVLGALFLVDEAGYFGAVQSVNWVAFSIYAVLTSALFMFVIYKARHVLQLVPQTGTEAMTSAEGVAKSDFEVTGEHYEGMVFADGARWRAVSQHPINQGETVKVKRYLSAPMRLEVEPSEATPQKEG